MTLKRRFSIVEREEIVEKSSQCIWTKQGEIGREYLLTKRALSEKVVRDFKLGYMPGFVNHQLRGRIILPLYDPSGNLIVVGSRAIEPSEFLPVYWHESYEKQFYLFGMDRAREAIVRHKFCIVCEGQFDVLQAACHGIKNIVGLCGNKLSQVQISVIERYCDNVVLILDTDENQAGQQGAAKAIVANQYMWGSKKMKAFDNQSPSSFPSRKIISVNFSNNTDPDEFIRNQGIDEFKNIVRGKLSELRNRIIN